MKTKFKLIVILILVTVQAIFWFTSSLNSASIYENRAEILRARAIRSQAEAKISARDATHNLTQCSHNNIDYTNRYLFLSNCKRNYSVWRPGSATGLDVKHDYTKPAEFEKLQLRITRAVIVYLPLEKLGIYEAEFRWLYRSWVNMIKHESSKWRTDLVVFTDTGSKELKIASFFLNELNCRVKNRRRSDSDKPMCILIDYKPVHKRKVHASNRDTKHYYEHFLSKVDVFSSNPADFVPFYNHLIQNVKTYLNLDSVLIAFDGYEHFAMANYDFIIRTDMDVFLTPLFGKWLPRDCNDFCVGEGGYSSEFNEMRFKRIAKQLKFDYESTKNIGSTWYASPTQMRLAAYLSCLFMGFLAREEFTEPEKLDKLGSSLWPDWYYNVLSMYGGHLALNHLHAAKKINLVKLTGLIDAPSANSEQAVATAIHVHVFPTWDMFSKYAYRMGHYDKMAIVSEGRNASLIKYYALNMALEAKRISNSDLYDLFLYEVSGKN